MVLKALEIATAAATLRGRKQEEEFLKWARFMRRSKITFDDFSLVATHFANALHKLGNGRATTNSGKRHGDCISAHRANRRKSSCGLRVFSKAYRVRGLLLALGAVHRHRIKLHVETPNVM